MSQENRQKGYESEDGIGVVYDVSPSKHNRILCVLLVIVSVLLSGLIGYMAGFWAGENEIIEQSGLIQSKLPGFDNLANNNYNDFPELDGQDGLSIYNNKPIKEGIFPPPMGIFSAGNGDGSGGLSEEEKKRLEEAKAKCDAKKCCREDDDINTDSSKCPDLGYLECLAADNACVWDCTEGKHDPDELHYDREFKGVNRGDGVPIKDPYVGNEGNDGDGDVNEADLLTDTVDECGTVYEFHLKEKDRLKEEQRIKNSAGVGHQEGNSGEPDGGNDRRLLINATEPGEMNDTLRRQLYIMGYDQRTRVYGWQYPYYKVVKIYSSAGGCSGALISPRHVLTAAHCISDGEGRFYSGWTVYPNYATNSRTASFSVYQAWVFNGWHYNKDWHYDIGILTLHTSNTGFGWFGFGWSTSISSYWNFGMVGYPGDRSPYMMRQNLIMDGGIHSLYLQTKTGDNWKGNSGGPIYYESNKAIYAVVSVECCCQVSGGSCIPGTINPSWNGFARITKGRFDAMCSYISRFPETSYYKNYI